MPVADVLSTFRLVAAPVFAIALGWGGWTALGIFAAAAATDFMDGRVARRAGRASARGAVLDNVGDVVFVLAGTIQAARLELLAPIVPISIAVSVGAYAIASFRRAALARSRLGHAAGIANWAACGLAAGAVATAWDGWPSLLDGASVATATLNVAAVAARLPGFRPTLPRART